MGFSEDFEYHKLFPSNNLYVCEYRSHMVLLCLCGTLHDAASLCRGVHPTMACDLTQRSQVYKLGKFCGSVSALLWWTIYTTFRQV